MATLKGDSSHPPKLPYGRQSVDEEDIRAVVDVLRSDWLTTGPVVERFEAALAETAGTRYAVAVSSGTAALHAAMHAVQVQPGEEVIVPAMTFASTANAAVFERARPVFADVDPDTLLLDPASVESRITRRTRAIVGVDYAGQPCDYDALRDLADRYGLALIDDACHSIGGSERGRPVGSLADMSTFSFHPVKHVTTGEGGAVVTDDAELASRVRLFRNHGITTDHRQRAERGSWFYEMVELGYNYRITDFQCALGISQLRKLSGWIARRQQIADRYRQAFDDRARFAPLAVRHDVSHAFHLFVGRIGEGLTERRAEIFRGLHQEGIGVNVHYIPVHLHPFYRRQFGTGPGLCPVAESAYERLLTLPLFPTMSDDDTAYVVRAVDTVMASVEFAGDS